MMLFSDYQNEIKQYCEANNLNYNKACQLIRCSIKDMLVLQYHDPEKGKQGLLNEEPAPIVLIIHKSNNKITFEQTENTKKYLS